ncbi:hypothetical protein Q4485_09340 [Granulosicoccaceae sp. 1_MG-2023]|nr:hypothetical protein [Granulosicoccaceae sp. 1_MG-2023]
MTEEERERRVHASAAKLHGGPGLLPVFREIKTTVPEACVVLSRESDITGCIGVVMKKLKPDHVTRRSFPARHRIFVTVTSVCSLSYSPVVN